MAIISAMAILATNQPKAEAYSQLFYEENQHSSILCEVANNQDYGIYSLDTAYRPCVNLFDSGDIIHIEKSDHDYKDILRVDFVDDDIVRLRKVSSALTFY